MTSSSAGALTSIRILADGRRLQTLAPGTVIFRAGDQGSSMYAIVDGRVSLTWGDGSDSEELGPGSTFGVGALVDPDHRRYGTATVRSETKLLEMNREQFLFAMQELPMFGVEMLHDLEERLNSLKERVSP